MTSRPTTGSVARGANSASGWLLRYGLVVIVAWIGALKYTSSEAMRIQNYISNSPYEAWLNDVLGLRQLSAVIGSVEIAAAVGVALAARFPRVSAAASCVMIVLFFNTLAYMFTTPGIGDADAGGFPALSPVGQFLLKDLVLLGASFWTLGDALRRATGRTTGRPGTRAERDVVRESVARG